MVNKLQKILTRRVFRVWKRKAISHEALKVQPPSLLPEQLNNMLLANQAKVGHTVEMKFKMTLPQIRARRQYKAVVGLTLALE